MNENWKVPPPPPSLKEDRELYLWLALIHDLLNGIQSGFILSMDTSGAIANAAAARAAAAERLAADAALLSAPSVVMEMESLRAEITAVRAQNAELQKQVDGIAMLMQARVIDPDAIIRDAVLLAGGTQ